MITFLSSVSYARVSFILTISFIVRTIPLYFCCTVPLLTLFCLFSQLASFAVFFWVPSAARIFVVRCWRYTPRDSVRVLDGYGAPQSEIPVAPAGRYLPHGNVGHWIGDDRLWLRRRGFSEGDEHLGAFQCGHWGEVLR